MPTTVRTVRRLYAYLIGAVILIAALVVAVIALVFSTSVAACVNDNLGQRAKATQIESKARLRANDVETRYFDHRATRAQLLDAKHEYSAAMRAANAYRRAHPAGRC